MTSDVTSDATTEMNADMTIDPAKLDDFVGRFAGDLGAVLHAATVLIGDRLGLYAAMADGEPVTPATLAERSGCDERYLTEWLAAQAASGYVEYDAETGTFHLTAEQAFALTSEDNPFFAPGGLQVAASTIKDVDLLSEALRSGRGVEWGEHHEDLFAGTDRFFKPNYIGNLVDAWLPTLDGVVAKLNGNARVADVGCGYGSSTVLMAQAFPRASFVGFDSHPPSVQQGQKRAMQAGVAHNCRFEVAGAQDFPGTGYDLVTSFDCLHDMGDPVGAAAHVLETLAHDGTWMIVEPHAGDRLQDNLNPVGRIFYSASTLICVPSARSQEGGLAIGAQAGELKTREIAQRAGFTRFRRGRDPVQPGVRGTAVRIAPDTAVVVFAAGLLFLLALVLGIWKYRQMVTSPTHLAHPYVDTAHRAALLYSFATTLVAILVELSAWSRSVDLVCAGLLVFFFLAAIASYVFHGLRKDTDNQFRDPAPGTHGFMIALMVSEIGAFGVLLAGFAAAQV